MELDHEDVWGNDVLVRGNSKSTFHVARSSLVCSRNSADTHVVKHGEHREMLQMK